MSLARTYGCCLALLVSWAATDGLAQDCNGNTIPDRNDIDTGRSLDCDGDGIPDECPGSIDLGSTRIGRLATGDNPTHIVHADFNLDGHMDMASSSGAFAENGDVRVFMNAGHGRYFPAEPIPAGDLPSAVGAGDLDGDGFPDLAVSNLRGSDVMIFLNRSRTPEGADWVRLPESISVGRFPSSMALEDLDGDGDNDIITANLLDDSLTVLRNEGLVDGELKFAAARTIAVGSGPEHVTCADLDGDGKMDVLAANATDHTVSILYGADGLTIREDLSNPGGPKQIAIADVDRDGDPDIAVADNAGGTVTIFRNGTPEAGGSRFQHSTTFEVSDQPVSITPLDANSDGAVDFAVASFSEHSIDLLINDREGGFQLGRPIVIGLRPTAVIAGNADLDGSDDLFVTLSETDQVAIAFNQGLGDFHVGRDSYDVNLYPVDVLLEDFDGDDDVDIMTVNDLTGGISFLANEGVGVFADARDSSFAFPQKLHTRAGAAGDADADGDLDVVLATAGRILLLAQNDGSGNFSVQPMESGLKTGSSAVELHDLLGDAKAEVALLSTESETISILELQVGDPLEYKSRLSLPVGAEASVLRVVDLDGDGLEYLRATNRNPGRLVIYWNETLGYGSDRELRFS
ncbi:MAG: VCBS repeat-containing protein, partial [Planctomycetota bacterium]